MNYSNLRTQILASMKYPPKITAQALQEQLINIVNGLDLGALLLGVATPLSTPDTQANGFYFGLQPGTYTNFPTINGETITVDSSEVAIIGRSGNYWSKIHITTYPTIDPTTKHWMIGNEDTGVLAEGTTPHIDQETGNWMIGTYDTGVHAQGAPGKDAYQPFKGTFSSVQDLNAAYPEPNDGDTAYVEDTVENTTVLKVYDVVNGEWHDTGTTADSPVFGSGQLLSSVKIDDTHLANPADGSLPKAEDVMQLKAKLEGVTASETKVQLVTSGEGQNVFAGKIVGNSGNIDHSGSNDTNYKYVEFEIPSNVKSIRFMTPSGTGWTAGWAIGHVSDGSFVTDRSDAYVSGREFVVKVNEGETHFRTNCYMMYGTTPTNRLLDFYCYLQSGNTVMDEIASDFYEYKDLGLEDLGIGYVPDIPTAGGNLESQIQSNTQYYKVLKCDIGNAKKPIGHGKVTSNLTRYIYFYADANGNYIDKENIKGSSGFKWQDYELNPPTNAKYLYINATISDSSYYKIKSLVLKDFVTEEDIQDLESLPERVDDAEQNIVNIENVLSKEGDVIVDYEETSSTRLEYQEVGKTITQCQHSSSILSYRKYEVIPDFSYIFNGRYVKISNYIIPVVWTDENEVIIKVEPFRTSSTSTVSFSSKKITAPTNAKYLFMNVQDAQKSVTNLRDTTAVLSSTLAKRKTISILSIGNSYSQDALAYVPYIIRNMGVDVDVRIGILMQSSSSLSTHWSNFDNETAAYQFLRNFTGNEWIQRTGTVTIQWALEKYQWDIILLQQASSYAHTWSSYQPYLNKLVNGISALVKYPVKFGWYAVQSKATSSANNAPYSDQTINERWQAIMTNSQKVFDETVCEFIIPVSTAIQNARTIPFIKEIGSYANNGGNGVGYLEYEGVHLQEGLPCQIAAYTFVLSLLGLYGFVESINGESTIVDSEWENGRNIPAPHGEPVGSNETNILIAQKCAIMAYRHPFVTTDMNEIVNPS